MRFATSTRIVVSPPWIAPDVSLDVRLAHETGNIIAPRGYTRYSWDSVCLRCSNPPKIPVFSLNQRSPITSNPCAPVRHFNATS